MTNRIKSDALVLEPTTLPTSGTEGEIRLDAASGLFKGWNGSVWSSLGGGGAGGGLRWNPVSGSTPIEAEENGELVYLFALGGSQLLDVFLKVPDSYAPGSPVKFRLAHYSPDAAGTGLMEAVSYLIKKDVDAVSSTTNSHASTNVAVTNTVIDQYREIVLDISDAAGLINGVAVGGGDLIRVELTRGSDSGVSDIRFIPSATEVTLT
jgi:hypothetical protein